MGLERDDEDGMSSSQEEGEHNVEKFLLCSFVHHACSPLLQESLHEIMLRSERSFSGVWSVVYCCSFFLSVSPIEEGLQQCGEGCGGRQVQVS